MTTRNTHTLDMCPSFEKGALNQIMQDVAGGLASKIVITDPCIVTAEGLQPATCWPGDVENVLMEYGWQTKRYVECQGQYMQGLFSKEGVGMVKVEYFNDRSSLEITVDDAHTYDGDSDAGSHNYGNDCSDQDTDTEEDRNMKETLLLSLMGVVDAAIGQ